MTTLATLANPFDFQKFPWMRFALQEIGQAETPNQNTHNPRILAYQAAGGNGPDEGIPWCSAFVNWCMLHAGIHGTHQGAARSWLMWGDALPVNRPIYGCVVVFTRPPHPWNGHVGFYAGSDPVSVSVLGGNQGNRVCIQSYPRSSLLACRWPSGFPQP